MKNILIIGNGFDLAHGLPTSYSDFLDFLHCVELTSTWHENKNSFLEQHVNNKKFNDVIMQFISNAFDSRKINSGKKYTNSNLFVQEMYDKLGNNIWYHFLQYVHESGKMKGINWIDFESEISLVIERIDKEQPNIHMPFQIAVTENDAKMTNFSNMAALFLKKYIADKGMSEKYSATYYDFIEKSYLDLRNLVRCLEIYLTECVDKIPITKISPDINGIDVQAVLNFNYTLMQIIIYLMFQFIICTEEQIILRVQTTTWYWVLMNIIANMIGTFTQTIIFIKNLLNEY